MSARALRAALAVILGLAMSSAQAWGRDAHRLVAELAGERLAPAARDAVQRLLALEPGATLASVSTWPDEVRSPTTAPWHYVNFRRDGPCDYSQALCLAGGCVVAAIERQATVLASDAPDEDRLKALKYVVHFVADLHQPLHAGYWEDRGGNSYQLQAFGRGTNLHALWDTGIVDHWPVGLPALAEAVRRQRSTSKDTTPAAWAEDACRIVATPGFYPDGRHVDEAYQARWSPTVVQQLALAADRLATLLNQSLTRR